MPAESTLIILDFDHTLFNTTRLVQAEAERFERAFDIPQKVFRQTRDTVKICCVVEDIDRFVQLLPHPDKAAMHEALLFVIRTVSSSCLFADVLPSLEILKRKADVLLATHGDPELQEAKIRSSGIPAEFPFAITQTTKSAIVTSHVNGYTAILLVDDKPENLQEVKAHFPSVRTCLITRPDDHPYSESSATYPSIDSVVTTLAHVEF
jgi:hypothetical protein